MKRICVVGYLNNITRNNSIEDLRFHNLPVVTSVKLGCNDHDGFSDSRTLEVVYDEDFGEYYLLTSSTQEGTQFSNSDACFNLMLGGDKHRVIKSLRELANNLEKEG